MGGKQRSFTIYHRDTDPSQPNAPAQVPQDDARTLTKDDKDRSKIEEENRRLEALLRQHGISDATDADRSVPSTDGLGFREQAAPRSAPAPLSATPSTEALQDQGTVGDGGGASIDSRDLTVEQDLQFEPMLVGSSSISESQQPQYNENCDEGPVSKKQKRSSSLPPSQTATRPQSSRPLPMRRHSSAIGSAKQDRVQHVLALREHSGVPAASQEQQTPALELAERQRKSTAPSAPTAPNEANSAVQATQQPFTQQDQIDVQPDKERRLIRDTSLHELLPVSAPSTHAHFIRELYNPGYQQRTRSAKLRGEQWLPDMLVTAIWAASRGDGVLKRFLDRESYPRFWFHCFTSSGDRRLDYSIYREGNKVDVGIHKGLPFIYEFDHFVPIFDDYRARISMYYDSPDKPWSFHLCEGYWKVGTELNRPKEGIASSRGGLVPKLIQILKLP